MSFVTVRTPGLAGEARLLEERLLESLARKSGVLVAFSGGVDSTYLAWAARQALAERAVAVTAVSASLAAQERAEARALARHIGIRHEEIETDEMENEAYRANRGDRCYFCKEALFRAMARMSGAFPGFVCAYGAITDDLGDDRPGMDAARAAGAWAPLLETGMSKAHIRERSRAAGLPTAEKPAMACLASRIPVGTRVDPVLLTMVERAEAALHRLGFGQVRVRHEGAQARIEVDEAGFERFLAPDVRSAVEDQVRKAGFERVVLDLRPWGTRYSISGV